MIRALLPLLLVAACGSAAPNAPDAGAPDAGAPDVPRVIAPCDVSAGDGGLTVRGRAYNFGPGGSPTRGAIVRALEHPERCAVVDARSDFTLSGFAPGELVSLRMEHPDFPPIQTGTHAVPEASPHRDHHSGPLLGHLPTHGHGVAGDSPA